MKTIHSYLFVQVLRSTAAGLVFFTMVVILLDLFTNISIYITHDIGYMNIMRLSVLYIPKAMSFALAPAILFGVTYSLSSMHARNEIISILNSGISYYALISILLIFGLLMSFGNFWFTESVVIDSFRQKQDFSQELTGFSTSYNNSNVVLISENQEDVYYARYYNDRRAELTSLVLIDRDEDRRFLSRTDIDRAVFDEQTQTWRAFGVREYVPTGDRLETRYAEQMELTGELFSPEDFRNITYDVNEMHLDEAREHIERIQRLDMQRFRELSADYHERYAFALTPLIVVLISCSIGTRFKKNILLYSLLLCIIISLIYYVSEMLTMLLAKQGFLPPAAGGWLPVIFFTAVGFLSLFKVRT
jgi:lipopolysaccharide export system permease protein